MADIRNAEADYIWQWIRHRLPANLRLEAEERLRPDTPEPSDPELVGYVTTLLAVGQTEAKRAALQAIIDIILESQNPTPQEDGPQEPDPK